MPALPATLAAPSAMPYEHCVECGRRFESWHRALVCSAACAQRRWRACAMLAGTHGWVDGQFKRLASVAVREVEEEE